MPVTTATLLHALLALLAAALLHPLDVVRLRLQAAGTGVAAVGYGVDGPGDPTPTAAGRGLYDGLSAGLAREALALCRAGACARLLDGGESGATGRGRRIALAAAANALGSLASVPAEVRLVRSAVGIADGHVPDGGGVHLPNSGGLARRLASDGAAPQLMRDCILGACAAKVLGRGSTSPGRASRPPRGPAGAVLGGLPWILAASLAAAPFDLAKTRIQASPSGGPGGLDVLREAFKEEGGLAGLLRGTLPLAARHAASLVVLGWLRDRASSGLEGGGGNSGGATYEVLLQYESLFPAASTEAERMRFLRAHYGDVEAAAAGLGRYLDWRRGHGRPDGPAGTPVVGSVVGGTGGGGLQLARRGGDRDWDEAASAALAHRAGSRGDGGRTTGRREKKTRKRSGRAGGGGGGRTALPRTTYAYPDGVFQHLPARVDLDLAPASVYADAVAVYIDDRLDRRSDGRVTILIDTRSGHGWSNMNAFDSLPYIQEATRVLGEIHPERLERCVICPVPAICHTLWEAVRPFMSRETADKIVLVSGPAGKDDPMPAELGRHLPPELVERLEEQRRRVMARESGGDGRRSGGDGGAEGLMRSTTYLRGSDGTSTVNTKGLEGKLARAGGLEEDGGDPWWRSFLGEFLFAFLAGIV